MSSGNKSSGDGTLFSSEAARADQSPPAIALRTIDLEAAAAELRVGLSETSREIKNLEDAQEVHQEILDVIVSI